MDGRTGGGDPTRALEKPVDLSRARRVAAGGSRPLGALNMACAAPGEDQNETIEPAP
jgi:hypothetical protein